TIRGEERTVLGRVYRSSVSARAGPDGTVVQKASLLEGLMSPVGDPKPGDDYPRWRSTIRVSVLAGAKVLATASAVRVLRPDAVRMVDVRPAKASVYGEYFVPARASGVPILYLGGSAGGLPWYTAPALLAAHGHPVLALAYFSEPGLPPQLENIPLEYFRRG